jgi:uncharacterized protein with HEPN domain
MERDARAFLWDVREAGLAIREFTRELDVDDFVAGALVQAAVERKFEVIGEALNQLSKRDSAIASRIPKLSQIVAFRNQLIHGYANINAQTVWGVVEHSLPELLASVTMVLNEFGEA